MRGVIEFRHRLMTASGANKADPYDNYLTIEALEDGLIAQLSRNACEYCIDGDGNWRVLPAETATDEVSRGQRLHFRGNITPLSGYGIGQFSVNKEFNLRGNAMSMLYGDEGHSIFSLEGKGNAFNSLFNECYGLKSVHPGFLPATTLSVRCYNNMFGKCENLTQAPELPAVELKNYCYEFMFEHCESLKTAPVLPAITLEDCCYDYMFRGCRSLNYIKALFLETDGYSHTYEWVGDVSETGTFVKSRDAEWDVAGSSGIPEGWIIITE